LSQRSLLFPGTNRILSYHRSFGGLSDIRFTTST
jgi:hypothetical protein